ncbi:uncharacterized protein V6R79_002679, partial [Siganus canaliculatus]
MLLGDGFLFCSSSSSSLDHSHISPLSCIMTSVRTDGGREIKTFTVRHREMG